MPIVVVTDSSPLRALHHLGQLALCRDLYGSVIVPDAVRAELRKVTATCPAIEIEHFGWFEVRTAKASAMELVLPLELDAGETEAIGLAIELKADLVLIDERKGTTAARELGLTTIGVLGILLEAKRRGLIEHVVPHVERLIAGLKFFVAPNVLARLAELAGE